MTAGDVLGMAHTMVTPPARAAAVPDEKSSLCVAPGSRRCTCTSIRPKRHKEPRFDFPLPRRRVISAPDDPPGRRTSV